MGLDPFEWDLGRYDGDKRRINIGNGSGHDRGKGKFRGDEK